MTRFELLRGGKGDELAVLRAFAQETSVIAAQVRRRERARRCRELADQVRALMRNIEREVGISANSLAPLADRLDQIVVTLEVRAS